MEAVYSRFEQQSEAGNLQPALAEAERGLALCRHRKSDPWYWKFYFARAEVVMRKEDPAAALSLLQSDLPAGSEFAELRARRKWDQGRAEFLLSNYPKSRDSLAEAARLAQASESRSLLGNIEVSQSDVLSRIGDWSGAESSVREANRVAREQKDTRLEHKAAISLAFVLMQQSRFEEALYPLQELTSLLDERHEARLAAKTFTNMGWCYYRLGDLDKARRFLERAEAIDAKIGDTGEQQICLGAVGAVFQSESDLTSARQYYQRALRLSSKRGDRFYSAKWLGNLAELAIESGDWSAADGYNSQALEINRAVKDRIGEFYSLELAGRISAGTGANSDAERLFQHVAQSDSEDPAPVLEAEAGLARLYAVIDRPEKADQQFRATLARVEQSRSRLVKDEYKVSYLDSLMEFYQDYVDWLMSRGKTEQALEVVEASRARILSERTGVNRSGQTSSAARYKQMARASGSIFLSYWTAPKRSYVWAITPNQIVAYPLPPQSRIETLVEKYRSLIENLQNPLAIDDPTARELSETLLGPIRDMVPQGARVSVVPDGSLYALNFETLPVAGGKPHYWIEDATISVVPSLNLLSAGGTAQLAEQSILLIGNPEPADEHFPKLQYAGAEIAAIRRHFQPAQVDAIEGRSAVREAYTSSDLDRFAYLHFTAHATANRESPLDSAIILSARDGNYKLTAREVLKWPLRANLVTISACRSAGARTYAGEGLVGFTWTFFQAGAHNVIAGLWDVSDESTPKIMDRLYAGLAAGQPIPDALRAAKLALLNENQTFRLPYYWGALQLYCRDQLQGRGNDRVAAVASR